MKGFSRYLAFSALAACTASPTARQEDLDVLAGQHVIYSYAGTIPPARLLELARQGKVGGIILFGANIDNGTGAAIETIQAAAEEYPGNNGMPLLIMTDQEGGLVRRIKSGGPFLSAKEMGASDDPAAASAQGGEEAYEALAPVGINTNLAPVLDVYHQPGDFEDYFQRSFGNTSCLVSKCVAPFISTQQARGVIATAKHFPGLGAASHAENTDETAVTLNRSLLEIRAKDEVPYRAAMKAGVKMVMASWAVYPSLDPERPAGLSLKWIRDELRGRLGFSGVTITDALEAGALTSFGGVETRAVLAAQAGMDLLLASAQNSTQGETVMNAVAAALADGTLSRTDFDAATSRILSLRRFLSS
ncbi:Glycoside hydrolase family 3 protein [Pleurostoma richardsiae]|uniref:Glycoside hydrolase family 3 protein n=1 Tax=Pleurostoma richardsiae TaxID=41990 RepID=A0AA38S5A2_9PEZI|nr:Glycoside hydrolase family 3 protein [Pleurostoma richardsiae]